MLFFFQSAVTGEHTCMVLRPLNSDDIEVSESNKCGFLDPFYQGTNFFMFCLISFPFLVESA